MISKIDRESALMNCVWRECLKNETGKALFHGDTLAKRFLGEGVDWIDALNFLKTVPDIKIRAFYIDGLLEKIFEASINPIYCSKEYRKISRKLGLANYDYASIKQYVKELEARL